MRAVLSNPIIDGSAEKATTEWGKVADLQAMLY